MSRKSVSKAEAQERAIDPKIAALLEKYNQGIKLDIGCGNAKQKGFLGMDILPLPNVDIVWDIERFPWPLPDESVSVIMCSHIIEHISPSRGDPRLAPLVDLLLKKKLITKQEVEDNIGEHVFPMTVFMRWMDECWRVLKPGGEMMLAFPYGGSGGYWQDPTHVNGITEVTFAYFDPLHDTTGNRLYSLYEPKPWDVDRSVWTPSGNMEVLLIKRRDDKSYHLS